MKSKSSDASSTRSTFVGGRSWRLSALFLAASATIFCSCESTSQRSAAERNSQNPYAQFEPQNAEEEAYYQDVYSGDWREQQNPFGTGKAVLKKTGSTEIPPHWETLPRGAKTMEQIRFETAQTKAAQARRYSATNASPYAQAPTQTAYGAQVPAAPAPTPPQVPAISYPQAQAAPAASVAPQYVAQTPRAQAEAAPVAASQAQNPAPYSAYGPQIPSVEVAPPAPTQGSVAPTAPASDDYPVPALQGPAAFQGASVERNSFKDADCGETFIVRGQAPVDDEEDPFGDLSGDEDENAETESAVETNAPAPVPAVELKTENVKKTNVAAEAAVKNATAAAVSAAAPPSRIGGKVLPLQIDPSIAAPFANVNRPLPNPSAPSDANAPRSAQGEYVVSGGDAKDSMFSREDWSVENLDAEDTAAHFDAIDGRILSEPSNKVFLYSPRFGAVRQIVGPIEGENSVMLNSANTTTQVEQRESLAAADVREQEIKPLGATNAVAVGEAESRTGASIANANQGVIEAASGLRLGAILTSESVDSLSTQDAALMLQGGIAAQGWSGDQKVAVALETVNAFSNIYVTGAETVFTVDDDTKTSKLRLIKIANKDAARPGELVEFTLRFENIGDEPIGNVTILDNLSGRLAYVDNTAKSSVPAEFLAELNEKGSLILRWEITEPLEPKEFGVVRFICKVR